jgi:hypothetical protein
VSAIDHAQAVLARLCTDLDTLAAYRADPIGFARHHGAETARLLDGLDITRLTHYAQSLRWKRAREAKPIVPLLAHAMGAGYYTAFFAHAATVAPAGSRRPLADAMAFARAIAQARDQPRAVREAARFEWHSLDATFRLVRERGTPSRCHVERRHGVRVSVRRFGYELPALDEDRPVASWRRRTTVVLFTGISGRARSWYW